MVGQFSGLERKSIEPIALHLEGGNVRGMQRFISTAECIVPKIMAQYRKLAVEDLGDPDDALIFDETGFVKKGNDYRLMLCFRVLFYKQLNQGVKQGFATLPGIMNEFEKTKI